MSNIPRQIRQLSTLFPGLLGQRSPRMSVWCPMQTGIHNCRYGARSVYNIIVHLNDAHLWTRERIADWLETSGYNITFHVTSDADVAPPPAQG